MPLLSYHFSRSLLPGAVALMLAVSPVAAREPDRAAVDNLRKELADWESKMKEIRKKIRDQETEIAQEKTRFADYTKKNRSYRGGLSSQIDSLRSDLKHYRREVDSLTRSVAATKRGGNVVDIRVEALRKELIRMCDDLSAFIESVPPGNVRANSSAVAFLKGELETKTVTESEAIERLFQIIKMLREAGETIEVYTGASPAGGSTQVHFIRIGFVYLALVEEKGARGAVWVTDPATGIGRWKEVKNEAERQALWKAVLIKDRKAVPELVELPFFRELVVDRIAAMEHAL